MIKALAINDLHFGHKESKRMLDELSQFIDYVKDFHPQFIVIDGDYWDHKLDATDPAIYYGMSFFDELFRLCRKEHIILRMVQGTRSHDLNQLQLFKPCELDTEIDFRIIETVQEEDLLGLHILYLPEEYPEDAEAYYGQYKAKGKEYNMVFGHGTWDFVSFDSQIQHANSNTRSAPVFMWSEWKDTIPHGFISFGHIHGRNTYGKKIFYSGSFTRWGYGERSDKGFTRIEYDLDKLEYDVQYVNNDKAPRYDVISTKDLGMDLNEASVMNIQKALDEHVDDFDHIRITLEGMSDEKIDILRKYYANKPTVQIEVERQETTAALEESQKPEEFEKWHYITKRELPLNQMIQKYCKEEQNTDLTIDQIDKVLEKSNG